MGHNLRHKDPAQAEGLPIVLTDRAIEMVKEAMEREGVKDAGLRVKVIGGGCAGFHYSLNLDESARVDDEVVAQDGIKTFLDPISAQHLRGAMLDYVSSRRGTGFKFFNLDAARAAGCGSLLILHRCATSKARTVACMRGKGLLTELGPRDR
jgi:iron-sulfur cluster assembly accessory protein